MSVRFARDTHVGSGSLYRHDCKNCGPNSLSKLGKCIHCKRRHERVTLAYSEQWSKSWKKANKERMRRLIAEGKREG